MYLDFVTYLNLLDEKATGVKCDDSGLPGDFCDLAIEICISEIGKR